MIEKQLLRNRLKELLERQSKERSEKASKDLFAKMHPLLSTYNKILSFSNVPTEIDVKELNLKLAEEGKLHLPKIVGEDLWIYKVNNLKHLKINNLGILEPDPQHYELILAEEMDIILVPAIAFDHARNRLGRGRGFYDRLLKPLSKTQSWGIGYKEQLIPKVPITLDDIALTSLYLF